MSKYLRFTEYRIIRVLMMEDLHVTAEQKFIFMLKERIDKLEDEMYHMKKKFEEHEGLESIHNASRFHYLNISYQGVKPKEEVLDIIFRNRDIYEPCFASWIVDDDENESDISIAIVTEKPLSCLVFKKLIVHDDIEINTYESIDYRMFRNLFFYESSKSLINFVDDAPMFYQACSMSGIVEYWWRYAYINDELAINPKMTNEPFTQSDNYSTNDNIQKDIHKRIYVDKDIAELVQID